MYEVGEIAKVDTEKKVAKARAELLGVDVYRGKKNK